MSGDGIRQVSIFEAWGPDSLDEVESQLNAWIRDRKIKVISAQSQRLHDDEQWGWAITVLFEEDENE